jgi:hypothetical protein
MSETPLAPRSGPQSPPTSAEADRAAEPKPSKWRKAVTPVVLVLLGLVLFLLTIVFYPSGGTDVATPFTPALGYQRPFRCRSSAYR